MATDASIAVGDGCRLNWRADGSPDAPPLILSNSLGTTLDMWAPQVEPLTRRFRLIRYDTRGHGGSDQPPGAYGMDRLGRDVLELADALHLDRFNYCGLSIGGMVGQWLAARAPERVSRLILANTAAVMGPPSNWQTRIDAVRRDGMGAIADSVLQRWFTPAFRAAHPDRVAPVADMLRATDPAGYAGCCAAIRDMDLRAVGPLNRTPTLVIVGRDDPATPPALGRAIAEAAADARLVALDAAHLSNLEQPDAFTAAALDFLEP